MVFKLQRQSCSVRVLWVPAHVGVEENEVADGAARTSLGGDSVEVEVPFGRMECRGIISEKRSCSGSKSGRKAAIWHIPVN